MDSNFSYSNLLLEDTDSIVEGDSSSSCIGTSTGTNSGNRDFSEGLRALVVDSLLGHWETTPLLKKYHYEVTNVLGGEEVLNLLRQKPGCFDLVISEVNLPGMSGFELLKSITKEFLTLPVFLMSKDCKPEMVKKGIMKGASYYLRKPLAEPDIEKLWQHVYLKRLEKKVDNKNKDQNESLGQDSSRKQKEKTPELSKKKDPRKNPLSIDISCPPAPNSSNIVWDDNLHHLFVQAVEHLGINGRQCK
ncbi:hypothetical protein MKW94_012794 [Papaver nudicaule]|uniref:Response regulatory domain-containing protein n=1 Tax=Papaver nudicaule TaxID=74823 RepID=A0AA41W2Y5_PAPNU|nr:hypothetical protein [Papaver nudicaule]